MANVKVHLKEIIKYVLLTGLGIQSILGVCSSVIWIADADSFIGGLRSLFGIVVCAGMSYGFLYAWNRKKCRWMYMLGTLGIVTTPMVLQTGLEAGKELLIAICVTVVFIFFMQVRNGTERRVLRIGNVAFAMVLILVICNVVTDAPSFAARLASRCCYPQLYGSVSNTPQSLQDRTGYLELRDSLRSADGIGEILYPSLLQRHGSSVEADVVCYELAWYGLGNNTKDVMVNTLWDGAGYHFPMIVAELQLQGKGYDSVTGHNYGTLTERNGGFAQFYWKYSVLWSGLSLLMVMGVLCSGKKNGNRLGVFVLFEVAVLCFVLHGGGVFDYKNLPVAEFIKMGTLLDGLARLIKNKDE